MRHLQARGQTKNKRVVFSFVLVVSAVVFVLGFQQLSFVLVYSSYAGGALVRGMTVFRTLGRR